MPSFEHNVPLIKYMLWIYWNYIFVGRQRRQGNNHYDTVSQVRSVHVHIWYYKINGVILSKGVKSKCEPCTHDIVGGLLISFSLHWLRYSSSSSSSSSSSWRKLIGRPLQGLSGSVQSNVDNNNTQKTNRKVLKKLIKSYDYKRPRKCVLSLSQKLVRDEISLMSDGSAFQFPGTWPGDGKCFVSYMKPGTWDDEVAAHTGPKSGLVTAPDKFLNHRR